MKSKYIPFIFLVLVFLILFAMRTVFAQQWPMHIVKDNVNGAWIKTDDFDNDADPDLVIQNGDTLFLYKNISSGWQTHIIDTDFKNSGISSLEILDLDMDGDKDILQLPHAENSVLAWNENIDGQNWQRHEIKSDINLPGSLYGSYGDIDNDNDVDIVISFPATHEIVLFENIKGKTNWITKYVAKTPGEPLWTTVAHINEDSFLDIVAGSYYDGHIVVYLSQFPDTTWEPHKIANLDGSAVGQCRDIDGDGDQDIITHSNISNKLVWYENPSWTEHLIDEGLPGLNYGFAGDMDQDGDYDIVFGSSAFIGWNENLGDGKEWRRFISATMPGSYPTPTGLADLNADGYLDITAYSINQFNQGSTFWLANPWFVGLDDPQINKAYINPENESLETTIKIQNPNLHPVSVKAVINSFDGAVSDTVSMFDDGVHKDGDPEDNIFGAIWPAKSGNGYYSVSYRAGPNANSNLVNTITDSYHFTTSGPAIFNDYSIITSDTIPNPGDYGIRFNINLKNKSATDTIYNVSAKISSLDSSVLVIAFSDPEYDDISPGQIAEPHRHITMNFAEDCPELSNIPFAVDIYSDGHLFWHDTFNVFVNAATAIENMPQKPADFSLEPNFPNPFNPTTTLSYQLPKASDVELTIYNLLGQKVATLVNKEQKAGYYNTTWDASGLPSGVYIYQIKTDNGFSESRKLVLLK